MTEPDHLPHSAYVLNHPKPVRITIGDDGENYIVGMIPVDEHGRLHPLEVVRFLREAADMMAAYLEKGTDEGT